MDTKTELSRAAIVDRAMAIADDEGIAAITIRRLAQEFGVTPMALYWHVENKLELLDAMGRRFFDDVRLPRTGRWNDRLRGVVESMVEAFRQHPGSAHLAAAQTLQCEPGRELTEEVLGLLIGAGFTDEQASDVARTGLLTAVSLVIDQAGAEVNLPSEQRDQVRAAKHEAIVGLPPERYPNLVKCAEALTSVTDEQAYYGFGVDLYVKGVERLHASLRTASARRAESRR